MYLRPLRVRDICPVNGHGAAAGIGLNADGGWVALCNFGGHEADAAVLAYFSFVEPAPSLRATALLCSEGYGKLLLFRGICPDGSARVQGASRDDIAVLVLYSTVQENITTCQNPAGEGGGDVFLGDERIAADDAETVDLLSCGSADFLVVFLRLRIVYGDLVVELCENGPVFCVPCGACGIVRCGAVCGHGGDVEALKNGVVVRIGRHEGTDEILRNALLSCRLFLRRDLFEGSVLRRFQNFHPRGIAVVCAVSVVNLAELHGGKCLPPLDMPLIVNTQLYGIVPCLRDDALCRKGGVLVFGHGRRNGDVSLRLHACPAVQKPLCGGEFHILTGVKERVPRVSDGVCREGKMFACGDGPGGERVKFCLDGIYDRLLCIVCRFRFLYLFLVGVYFAPCGEFCHVCKVGVFEKCRFFL